MEQSQEQKNYKTIRKVSKTGSKNKNTAKVLEQAQGKCIKPSVEQKYWNIHKNCHSKKKTPNKPPSHQANSCHTDKQDFTDDSGLDRCKTWKGNIVKKLNNHRNKLSNFMDLRDRTYT